MQLWRAIVEGGFLSDPWFTSDADSMREFYFLDRLIVSFQDSLFE